MTPATTSRLLRIGLPSKGRLAEISAHLLNEAGLSFRRTDRSLFARCRDMPVEVTFLRTDDIPVLCAEGAIDLGVTGADLVAAHLAGDGFISLSFQENFGYAAAEAVAYGLPVILSPGHDLAHEMPALDGRFACGWLLGDNAQATAVAAIREWAGASDGALAAAGGVGRSWAAETLPFERFRDTLTAMV
jgi:glycosyltransferase involved in cell wall biosynthesis